MSTYRLSDLLHLAWPIVVSRSTQVVVGLCDALMVAHLGDAALAAVSAGGMNAWAAFIFPMGIVFIVSSFSSQLTGRGDPVSARRFGWYGLILSAATHILATAALPALPWVLSRFDYTPEVEAAMNAYLGVRLLSTGAAIGIEALGNFYGGLGNTAILMKTNVAAMAMNVAFNWVLIFGKFGMPAMGIRGAALASVLATCFAFAGFLLAFLRDGRALPRPRLRWREFRRMLRFGFPSGLNWSFEFFAFIAFVNVVVAGLGTSSLAAMMSVIQLNALAFMPAFGLASAGAILAGQSIGAGRKDDVPSVVRMTFGTAAIWMGLVGLVYLVAPAWVLAPFASQGLSDEFLQVGVRMLAMSALWQVFDAAGLTLTESLRAAGDTAFPMWTRAFLAWGVFLPGSWLSVRHWGGDDIVAMGWLLLYLGLLALALFFRFRSGAWRRFELVETELPV